MKLSVIFSASEKMFRARTRAGVLQLALGIGLVVSIICASMIMLVYFNKLAFLKYSISDVLRDNSKSGIHYAMANRTTIDFNQPVSIDLFGESIDSVTITRKPWGLFEAIICKASRGNNHHVTTALITPKPDDIGMSAMYLPDHNAPLYLVGKTVVTGTVYASERKFSGGAIDGRGYEGKTYLQGEFRKSEPRIPQIDSTLIHLVRELAQQNGNSYHVKPVQKLETLQSLSFEQDGANYFFTQGSLELGDTLQGNLIIHSSTKIRITREARLNDIIVIAPEIEIEEQFSGSLQCFATRMINVGKGSELTYPSALVLIGGEHDSTIVLHEHAKINGLVVIPGYDQGIGSRGYFTIEKNARLHGMAYINGSADLHGSIWGHITARAFVTKIKEVVYSNHVRDAEMNALKRSPDLPGSFLWAHENQIVVAKWLE